MQCTVALLPPFTKELSFDVMYFSNTTSSPLKDMTHILLPREEMANLSSPLPEFLDSEQM